MNTPAHSYRPVPWMLAVLMLACSPMLAQPTSRISSAVERAVAPTRVLVTRAFERTPVRVVGWSSAGLLAAPANLPEELAVESAGPAIPARNVLALMAIPSEPRIAGAAGAGRAESRERFARGGDAARVRVTLVDGQSYIGSITSAVEPPPNAGTSEAGDAAGEGEDAPLVIQSSIFGEMRFELDDLLRIQVLDGATNAGVQPAPAEVAATTEDRVILANGDVIEGFVESIGAEVVISKPAGAKASSAATRLPMARCRRIEIANSAEPLAGCVLWIAEADGDLQVVRARDLVIGSTGEANFHPQIPGASTSAATGSPAANVPVGILVGLAPDAGAFVPLGRLDALRFEAVEGRRWTRPPEVGSADRAPLGLADVVIPGAMVVEWRIPRDVAGLTGAVVLPPEARVWGDCMVGIDLVGADGTTQKLWSGRLDSAHARHDVVARIEPASGPASGDAVLRVSVEPGERGAIQDRIVLQGFMLIRGPGAENR
ncbi:MAG: hypothetical protein IT435_14375 [Phycisphaerales bacterium]|nr:hypothetical protein [Phycisphaerales bacterium]